MPVPATSVVCGQCDKPEHACRCDKYCVYCHAQHGVRLCNDGLYYCPACREACEISIADRYEP